MSAAPNSTRLVEARNAATPAAPARKRIELLDVAAMLTTNPPPIDWVVEPLLIRGEVTMIHGREGKGKSLTAQALAQAVADPGSVTLPEPLSATPGRVLIVDAENGRHAIHRRLRGGGLTDASGYVVASTNGLDLREAEHLAELRKTIEQVSPSLVVLDSLASLAPGLRENEAEQVSPFMGSLHALARSTRSALLVLHHQGKGDSRSYRGSTAFGAHLTCDVALVAHNDDPDSQRRELRWGKSRETARPAPVWVRIDDTDGLGLHATTPFEPSDVQVGTKTEQLAERMAEVVAERGELQRGTLFAEVGYPKETGTVKAALAHALDAGMVEKAAHGKYGPPSDQVTDAGQSDGQTTDRLTTPLGTIVSQSLEEVER